MSGVCGGVKCWEWIYVLGELAGSVVVGVCYEIKKVVPNHDKIYVIVFQSKIEENNVVSDRGLSA